MQKKNKGKLSKERLIWMYTQMLRIREFEERVKRTFVEHPGVIRGHTHPAGGAGASICGARALVEHPGVIRGHPHLADGAEASIVGALATRQKDDLAMPSYRCHGYPIV